MHPIAISYINNNLEQPLSLPLVRRPLALIFAFPLCCVGRIEQVVHIASHAAPACGRRRINALERESRPGQLPAGLIAIRIAAATETSSEAWSTAARR